MSLVQKLFLKEIPDGLTLTIYDCNASTDHDTNFLSVVDFGWSDVDYLHSKASSAMGHEYFKQIDISPKVMRGRIAEVLLKRTNPGGGGGYPGGYAEIFFRIHGTYRGDAKQTYPVDTKGKITLKTSNWPINPFARPDTTYIQFMIGSAKERTITLNTITGISTDSVAIYFAFVMHIIPKVGPVIGMVPIAGKKGTVEGIADSLVNNLLYGHAKVLGVAANYLAPGSGVLVGMAVDFVFGKQNTDSGLKTVPKKDMEREGQIETTDGIQTKKDDNEDNVDRLLDNAKKSWKGYAPEVQTAASMETIIKHLPASWQEIIRAQ
ncbi:hypothetical protein HGRIS_005363 [Hohenbuehelia grisea]|uniref:Uncharacterized protein n=1 Tax=Hohenbuehelia grisea TaxID=104357 RepID=A0ABR3JGF0_9AGAR